MNIDKYIKDIFKYKEFTLNKQDEKKIKNKGLNSFIFDKLLSTKFRRKKIIESEKENILRKIDKFILNNEPIKITPCFGGYKQRWVNDFPGVGWAEIFHISFMLKYVSHISKIYNKGVVIEWESEDIILEYANNYSKRDLDRYAEEFRNLLKIFLEEIPKNIKLKLIRSREQYDVDILLDKINKIKVEKENELRLLDEDELKKTISKAKRNFILNDKDFKILSEKEENEYSIKAKAINLAFLDADYELREKYFEEDVIPVVFSFGIDKENVGGWLTLSSTSSSFCDFWAGMGILEIREDGRIIDRILSKQQYEKIKDYLKKIEVQLIKKDIPKSIFIYNGKLDI